MPKPLRSLLLPLTAVVILFVVPIGGNDDVTSNPNEHSRFLLAVSLAYDRTVAVDGAVAVYGTQEDLSLRNGRSYSDKAPGLALLAAPIAAASHVLLPRWGETRYPDYWPLRNLVTLLLVALPGALVPFLVLKGRTPLGDDEGAMAALLAVTTPIFVYASSFFSHVPAAVLAAGAWVLALDPVPAVPGRRWPRLFAAGTAAGFAITTEYTTALVGAVILLAMVASRRPGSEIAAFAIGSLAGLAPALAYHTLAFGSPWATGYAFKSLPRDAALHASGFFGLGAPSWERLWGVLLGASRGLIFYCPLLLLAPPGLVAMARRDRAGAWAVVAASCGYLLFGACFVDWKAGWGAAARHLVPLIPLLFLPIAHAVAALRTRAAGRIAVAALAAVSLGNTLLALAVSPHFPVAFEAPLAQVSMRSLIDGVAMPSAASALVGMHPLVVAALWAAGAAALAIGALVRLLPARHPWAFASATLALCIAASVSVQWAASPRVTPLQERIRAWYLERLGAEGHAREIWYGTP